MGNSFDDGVVGDPLDLEEEVEEVSSPSTSEASIAMAGRD
jgi:hypothetical protein